MPIFPSSIGSSGGSCVLAVSQDQIFISAANRDAYFASNPDKLKKGAYSVINGDLQQYISGTWTSIATVIKGEPGVGVHSGGTAGQVLAKKSNTDFDTEWRTGGGTIDAYTKAESDALFATQSAIDNKSTRSEVYVVGSESSNEAKAYTDSIVKEYETTSLYFNESGSMITDKPTGSGAEISTKLTTTDTLIYSATYAMPNDGVAKKDNQYILNLFFIYASLDHATFIRSVFTIDGTVVFDSTNMLNNATNIVNLYRYISSILNEDLSYASGVTVKLDIYGRMDTGTSQPSIFVDSELYPSGVHINTPISTLSANKIMTAASGFSQSQEEFNASLLARIVALESV